MVVNTQGRVPSDVSIPSKEVSAIIYFKSCPRCQGDLYIGEDMYGRYRECLQCGYQTEAREVAWRGKTLSDAKERVRAVAA